MNWGAVTQLPINARNIGLPKGFERELVSQTNQSLVEKISAPKMTNLSTNRSRRYYSKLYQSLTDSPAPRESAGCCGFTIPDTLEGAYIIA